MLCCPIFSYFIYIELIILQIRAFFQTENHSEKNYVFGALFVYDYTRLVCACVCVCERHAGSCIVARTLQDVLRAVRERASFVAQCGVKRAALASNKSLKFDNIQISMFQDV
jgi:hypothetical protein